MADPKPNQTSVCRSCKRPIRFYDMWHSKVQGEKAIRQIWVHLQDDQIDCPTGTTAGIGVHGLRPRAEPDDLCIESLQGDAWSRYSRTCYRKVKDADLLMCGIHARTVHEERFKQDAEQQRRAREELIEDGVKELIAKLLKHGIGAKHYRFRPMGEYGSSPTGMVIVDPEELLDLLESFEETFE